MGRANGTVTVDPVAGSSGVDYSVELDSLREQLPQQDVSQRGSSVDVLRPVPQEAETTPPAAEPEPKPFKPTRRFWFVMMSISALTLCGAIEGTIIANALPTISAALGGGNLFIWVPNAFQLASITALPLYAQLSNIFGRRVILLVALALFIIGCVMGGASTSMTMLVIARAIQGLGSGGVDTICETIVMDLVPLRERGKYMSYVSIGTTVGFAAGPFLGGVIVVKLGWRWIFYLNVIMSGAAFVMFFFSLRLKRQRGQTAWSKFKRIDFGGNAIFIGAIVAVLLALTWAGPVYRWSSAKIIVPLVLGLLGLLAFAAFEWNPRLAPEPSFPRAIVSNRTSSAVLTMTFVNSVASWGLAYFLPVYFQGVLGKSPLDSGIALAPLCALIIPFAVGAGILMSKVGKYRPVHAVGWLATLLTAGLCITLNKNSSPAAWVFFELIGAAGMGVLTMSLLPALQAPLAECHAATGAGTYVFIRGFGAIWGVTISSVVFNNVVKQNVANSRLNISTNSTVVARLAEGQAYQLATKAFLDSLPLEDDMPRDQIIGIFESAIHNVFYVLMAFAAVGLVLVLVEKEIPMRTEVNTEFGLDEGKDEAPIGDGENVVSETIAATAGSRNNNDTGIKAHGVDVIELDDLAGPSRR